MSNGWAVAALSLLAALCFAWSSALKHLSTRHAPDATQLGPRAVSRLLRFTVTHRLWLLGLACDVGGVTLQMIALHVGRLSVVQPLLMSGLLFAVLNRAVLDRRAPTRGEWGWAAALTAVLAAFVTLTSEHGAAGQHVDRLPAVVAAAVAAAAVTVLLLVGRVQTQARAAAALLGVAVGVIYAGTAALLKAVTDVFARSPLDVLLSWQLYAVVPLGLAGVVLTQIGFRAGPITASLAATTVVDPLVSIVIGVAVFDERLGVGPGRSVALAVLLVALAACAVQLARQPGAQPDESEPAGSRDARHAEDAASGRPPPAAR